MEKQHTTTTAPGRCEAGGEEPGSAIRKRTWFYYALARLAVTRNLVVAAAIAAMCVGAVGVTLWAINAKQNTSADVAHQFPGAYTVQPDIPAPGLGDVQIQPGSFYPSMMAVDFNQYPELYVPVEFTYKCGHEDQFTPADSQFSALDPAGYKAKLEQRLCPACQAQADYRSRKAVQKHAARSGKTDAAH